MENDSRVIYFDYLRVFSIFCVMIVHISVQYLYMDVNTFEWQTFNAYDSIVRWTVPVLVMISGALFLDRDIKIKTIYFKYVLRMAVAFTVWSSIYSIYWGGNGEKEILINAISGLYYHLWFIPMIIGLYICVPLIRKITESETLMKYFFVLAFVFAYLWPQTVQMFNDFGGESFIVRVVNAFQSDVNSMNFHFVLGYTCYFILGYYLRHKELSKKSRYMIYFLGIMGFAGTIFLNSYLSIKMQRAVGNYYGNFTVNVLLESIAVFVWFQYHPFRNRRLNTWMRVLSKYSFGAYLLHVMVMEQLDWKLGWNAMRFSPIAAIPAVGITVFVIAFVLSGIINHIPVLKKYIV